MRERTQIFAHRRWSDADPGAPRTTANAVPPIELDCRPWRELTPASDRTASLESIEQSQEPIGEGCDHQRGIDDIQDAAKAGNQPA